MRETEFLSWMLDSGYNQSKVQGFIQSCHEIEDVEGSIDNHFAQDGGRMLMRLFRYSAADFNQGRAPAHRVPVKGDPVRHTELLKKALKFYLDYLNCTAQQAVVRSGAPAMPTRKIYAKRKLRADPPATTDEGDNYYSQFRPRRTIKAAK